MDPPEEGGREAEEPERIVKESDALRLLTEGVFVFILLVQEYAKGKGRHMGRIMDMCGGPWKIGG